VTPTTPQAAHRGEARKTNCAHVLGRAACVPRAVRAPPRSRDERHERHIRAHNRERGDRHFPDAPAAVEPRGIGLWPWTNETSSIASAFGTWRTRREASRCAVSGTRIRTPPQTAMRVRLRHFDDAPRGLKLRGIPARIRTSGEERHLSDASRMAEWSFIGDALSGIPLRALRRLPGSNLVGDTAIPSALEPAFRGTSPIG
jgi:hypothetical protein